VNAELNKIDETHEVTVTLKTGETYTGFPDARQSKKGMLVLVARSTTNPQLYEDVGPLSLDNVQSAARVEARPS
jgi:hypothetical protein